MFNVLITAYTAALANQTVGWRPFLWWGNPKCKKEKRINRRHGLYGFDSIECNMGLSWSHIDFGDQERSGDQELSISGHWEVNYYNTVWEMCLNLGNTSKKKKKGQKRSLDVWTGHWWEKSLRFVVMPWINRTGNAQVWLFFSRVSLGWEARPDIS